MDPFNRKKQYIHIIIIITIIIIIIIIIIVAYLDAANTSTPQGLTIIKAALTRSSAFSFPSSKGRSTC